MGSGAGLSFARKQPASFGAQPMNAKKLDINFGSDDFFNTFSPATQQQKIESTKPSNKLKEVDDTLTFGKPATSGLNSNPFGFDLGSAASA